MAELIHLTNVSLDGSTVNDTGSIFPTGGEPPVVDITPAADGCRAGVALAVASLSVNDP